MTSAESDHRSSSCSIVIIGASGDLARRKLVPALFSLYCNDLLPDQVCIVGFARTAMSDEAYRELISRHLTCRYEPEAGKCQEKMAAFLKCCHYVCGQYDRAESFERLRDKTIALGNADANTVFYMAIPPSVFVAAAQSIRQSHLCRTGTNDAVAKPWTRVVIEKPFGRDSASSAELTSCLGTLFAEDQTYRIDHYLGKEVIQNLMILRFANLIFEPIWHREYIESISIAWTEKIGCEGRAGYFDNAGIIRDVVQNHLLQILALVTMERPASLAPAHISDEKVNVLRSITPITLDTLRIGQYTAATNGTPLGYLDDPEVPENSITPTYAQSILHIDNDRWGGVPFTLTAGKAVDTNMTEIRVSLKPITNSIFSAYPGAEPNHLVIRVQPNEAIELHVTNKVPGLDYKLGTARLNLHYASEFQAVVPDAYERLLLDVLRGDRSLFIRADELVASWDIVTPALHELEEKRIRPLNYAYGSGGPIADADNGNS